MIETKIDLNIWCKTKKLIKRTVDDVGSIKYKTRISGQSTGQSDFPDESAQIYISFFEGRTDISKG